MIFDSPKNRSNNSGGKRLITIIAIALHNNVLSLSSMTLVRQGLAPSDIVQVLEKQKVHRRERHLKGGSKQD